MLENIPKIWYIAIMFADVAKVKMEAGKGGDGIVSFNSSRANAKGGPDGGDGGDGGSIVVRADHNTSTLSRYRSSKTWQAAEGVNGGNNKKRGKAGDNIELVVPPGTLVIENEVILADLEKVGDEAIIAHGGRGGFGNAHFISSVRRSPRVSELGEFGEKKQLTFELKLVADVGLIGLPNAGKSTLLSVISNAKPKIANYPFTTLEPNLGVVDIDSSGFLVADIPGLIDGASKGKGLGDDFLRHVERTKVLLHLIDATSDTIGDDYKTIQKELKEYKIDLSSRPQMVVLTKVESVPKQDIGKKLSELSRVSKTPKNSLYSISSVASTGLTALLRATKILLEDIKVSNKEEMVVNEIPVIRLDDSAMWDITKKGKSFVVTGKDIEGFAKRTNTDQYQSIQRLQHILGRKGITRQLIKLGAVAGVTKIIIAGKEIEI